ncbi:RNB domain-containing ribonuclease [Streptosporangium sp. NBC_01755]|uniref:RNB domain-containing ribonuclease n=1 Tax=unclassified Streptosporangium TaxID=2632669 RepID=UPI002DDB3F16|nr:MULTISPECIES: RNB domain-containing ribonuclease [unclassified Streptosporangium]WSA29064.1 RNB domain-containing ribonuclease [Streptosporangium sp. NBC_01810]WSC99489.1 RNB domain-containing ribonuclease [Streptosporangium sp. NBC_01755]
MPHKSIRVPGESHPRLDDGFERIRREMKLPEGFPRAVVDEAEWVAEVPTLPRLDRTDLPLITIDPPGAMDLDQAVHLEEQPGGYRVWYAIADVGAFVRPGGAIDTEARTRGETIYMPDGRVPLHPPLLSEAAASLLPGVTRPAALWCVDLDAEGRIVGADVTRALVRSRERLDYDYVQAAIDTGTADGTLRLLAEIGRLRLALERARGGVTLPTPDQEVVPDGDGYRLELRAPLEAEAWNAQISLLTGMAAASMMLDAEIGLLRVLPPAPAERVAQVRRVAAALGVPWPEGAGYGDVVHALDPKIPEQAAFLQESTVLLRGAGYVAFNGEPPSQAAHAAVGAPYAHVTAPLRRLIDRYATEICLAIAAGEPVPQDVQEAMGELPEIMRTTGRRVNGVERACVDLVEAFVLRERVGQTFDAVVIDVTEGQPWGQVQLTDPAVTARCDGEGLGLGKVVRVRLTRADPTTREVRFGLA